MGNQSSHGIWGDIDYTETDRIIEHWDGCHNWRHDSITPWLSILDSFSYVVAWSTVTANFVYRDLFHAYVGLVLILNYLLVALLNFLIQSPALVGRNCVYSYQLPCYLIEVTFVFAIMYAWLLVLQRHNLPDLWWSILYVYLFMYLMILERHYRRINSPLQLWSSALIGTCVGTVAVGFMQFIVRPYSDYINDSWPMRWLGMDNAYFSRHAKLTRVEQEQLTQYECPLPDNPCALSPEKCLRNLSDEGRTQHDILMVCLMEVLEMMQRGTQARGLTRSDLDKIHRWMQHVCKHAQSQTRSNSDISALCTWAMGSAATGRTASSAAALLYNTRSDLMPEIWGGPSYPSQHQQQQQQQIHQQQQYSGWTQNMPSLASLQNQNQWDVYYSQSQQQQGTSGADMVMRSSAMHPAALLSATDHGLNNNVNGTSGSSVAASNNNGLGLYLPYKEV